jgi:hypothetical protein
MDTMKPSGIFSSSSQNLTLRKRDLIIFSKYDVLNFDDFLKQESLVVVPATFDQVVFPKCNQHRMYVCRPSDSLITFFFCGVPGHYNNKVRKNGF